MMRFLNKDAQGGKPFMAARTTWRDEDQCLMSDMEREEKSKSRGDSPISQGLYHVSVARGPTTQSRGRTSLAVLMALIDIRYQIDDLRVSLRFRRLRSRKPAAENRIRRLIFWQAWPPLPIYSGSCKSHTK